MMQQWSAIKRDHEGCVVLFRLGDFYEAFHEDARTVADVCDVTLTSRPVKKGSRAPMAGVPYHAADRYIAALVDHGLRVAIVEQVGSDPHPAKRAGMSPPDNGQQARSSGSLVEREVVRIVSPGTLLEEEALEAGSNNFLAGVVAVADAWGLAHADLTTGHFATTSLESETALLDELARLRPAELVTADDWGEDAVALRERLGATGAEVPTLSQVPAWRAAPDVAAQALNEHFGTLSLEAYGCERLPDATAAAGVLLAYALETQRGAARQLTGLVTYSSTDFMTLDAATRRSLELTRTLTGEKGPGTLLRVVDTTRTAMGARRLRARLEAPLVDIDRIEARLDAVALFRDDGALRDTVRGLLGEVPDVERLTNRVVSGHAAPREMHALAAGLAVVPEVLDALGPACGGGDPGDDGDASEATAPPPSRARLVRGLSPEVAAVAARIADAVADDAPGSAGTPGVIRRGYSDELDAIHDSVAEARDWISGLEAAESERTGIKSLKVGFNKVFGYYLEVPKSAADRVPAAYQRKQTLTSAERYVTPQLKEREREILAAEERIVSLERELYAALLGWVAGRAPMLLDAAAALGRLDVASALASVAHGRRYCRPELHEGIDLHLVASRHPVVEATLESERFVPNDMTLAPGELLVITGPNMAGKSTVLRQVALTVLLAQSGSYVPAESARIGLVDRIFTRVGAQDDIALGQSTFMVEMVEAARILHHATRRSLVVLDELGRGTSTYDGMAIAWAVMEALHACQGVGCRTLFATHYHELTALEDLLERMRNAHMQVADTPAGIAFLHTLADGPADRSYGIHVAELAGLPAPVTRRAWEILEELESQGGAPLQSATGRPPPDAGQLPLLAPVTETHPAIERLRHTDPSRMTPLEALNLLDELVHSAKR